jgi:hypothetical protein
MANRQRSLGMAVMLISGLGLTLNRVTYVPADWLGRLLCNETYMQSVDGIVGDPACGFNADVLFAAFFAIAFAIGLGILLAARRAG